ncbi:hypothetical protein Tco_1119344, partial [Tanacetum coccineum]
IVDHLHQPWRTFASIINKCLCGKVSGLDKIRLSRVQILWGMYYKENLDFVALIWEDLAYQIDNKDSKNQDKMFYPRFTKIIIHHFLEKDKYISMRNRTFMHTARDDSLLGTMRFVSRHEDTQIYGVILPKAMTNQAILDSVAYKTYYAIASGKKLTKAKKYVPSKKKPYSKPKLTKKKELVKADRGKGLNVLSEVALSEAAQLKEATKESKKDFHISQASSSGNGNDFELWVPDEQQRKTPGADEETDSGDVEINDDNSDEVTKDDDEDYVESDANDDKEASDNEKTYSNEDENLNLNQNYDDEEEKEKEDVCILDSFEFNDDDKEYDELYKDVNVRSKVAEHEEVRKGDAEMTDITHENASQENSYEQVIEDAHVTLTSSQKSEGSKQSSSVSSDFASKVLNLDNVPPVIDEVASLMNIKTPHEELSTQAPLNLSLHSYTTEFEKKAQAEKEKYIDIIEKSVKEIIKDEVKSQLPQILPKEISDFATSAAASLTEFELKKILLDKLEKSKSYRAAEQHRDLYDVLVKSYQLDKDLFDSYGKTYSLKRSYEDKDKDEDPLAGQDQGLKKRKTSKDTEPSRGSKSKESKSSLSKGSKSQSKSFGKSA